MRIPTCLASCMSGKMKIHAGVLALLVLAVAFITSGVWKKHLLMLFKKKDRGRQPTQKIMAQRPATGVWKFYAGF